MAAADAADAGAPEGYTLRKAAVDGITLTATHPISYVKTLIQLGHEPLPTYTAAKWKFWEQGVFRPGALRYSLHIMNQDGFFGLYRGLVPRLGSTLTYNFSRKLLDTQVKQHLQLCPQEADPSESWEAGLKKTGQKIAQSSIAEIVAITLSHPFQVLAIRSMAQFISREDAYDSMIGACFEISDSAEGVAKGLFAGLTPRIVGAVLGIALCETLAYVIRKQLASCDDEIKKQNPDMFEMLNQHASLFASVLTSSFTYPYNLTSTVMSVNGSRLQCASGHSSWQDCLAELKGANEHQRGSAIFFGRAVKQAVLVAAYAFHVFQDVTPRLTK